MRANASICAAVVTVLWVAGGPQAGSGRAHEPEPVTQAAAGASGGVTAEQFDRWMTELSNWGRWGDDDELGTLNLVTPAKRVQAAALVTEGVTVSLSRSLALGERVTFQRGFENEFALGEQDFGERMAWIEEQHRIGYHASPLTHLAGLTIAAGDALFLRTAGPGGFDSSLMPFLRERDVALIGADAGVDGGPIEGRAALPMHVFTLVALGMPLLDGVDLDALAEAAATANRWEFMLVVTPLPVANGAGSAVNPVAVF